MRYQKLLKLLAGLAGVMLAATGALLVAFHRKVTKLSADN